MLKFVFSSTARLLALCAFTSLSALAQPNSGGPVPDIPPPTTVPIDGGASLLMASGVAFGLNQLRARRLIRRAIK
ncbi:hypothetical protein I2I05_21575 [Hymenobacter sp. BT683]|uniref:VPDSG-CTERM sorting domain-containing protein n=1 Tax=Hymenobacter jeongseonensis TaxID=2791027 RepID=A0ABS0INT8_9BACT|nr:hypothetical protein [Hymenobacter jeongseonensis]MBF9239996.1 hypothetical protein [Hymenobacter jeongseonensis]